MRVLIALGEGSKSLIKAAERSIDNVECIYYPSVDEFIHESNLRHMVFDRVVCSSKFLGSEEDFSKLCDYIRQNMDSVSIVFISNAVGSPVLSESEKLFKKYFDSPLYTIMRVDRGTSKMVSEVISSSIVDINARYFALDFEPKKAKKFGRKKKLSDSENQKISTEISLTSKKVPTLEKSEPKDVSVKSVSEVSINVPDVVSEPDLGDSDDFDSLGFTEMGLSSVGETKLNAENSATQSDDFDLSIGDYGINHSDSGFVGDDELEELERFNSSKSIVDAVPEEKGSFNGGVESTSEKAINEGIELSPDLVNPLDSSEDLFTPVSDVVKPEEKRVSDAVSQDVIEQPSIGKNSFPSFLRQDNPVKDLHQSVKEKKPIIDDGLITSSKVNIVTGLSGSGSTAFIVNAAVRYSEQGLKVLILDLDYKSNGILSFIDTKKFYTSGCNRGIDKKKMYTEDGITIISNGYGMGISSDINGMLGSAVLKIYDIVLVDCPLDCLSLIKDEVFVKSNIIIGVISDISKLIETSNMLYDREYISLVKEVYISKKCRVANKNIDQGSLEELKSLVLFPNGCWLDGGRV